MRRFVLPLALGLSLAGCPSSHDLEPFDSGAPDAGPPVGFDAGGFDAGGFDAGGFDAGGFDAGRADAGCPDDDGDGQSDFVCGGADCDDTAPDVFFGAPETCDGRDQDCDGAFDEGGDGWCAAQMGPPNTAPPVSCQMGACDWGGCAPGFRDCTPARGCETDVTGDRDNCGGCGVACRYSGCSGGLCDPVVDVEAYDTTSCAIRASGTILCWGGGAGGVLGDGGDRNRSVAEPVPGLMDASGMDLGTRAGCAQSSAGDVACWGTGFLGDGSPFLQRALPTLVIRGGVDEVTVGEQHRCVVRSSGEMQCWGRNFSEALGVPFSVSGAQALTPIDVPMVTNAVDAEASLNNTCALLSTGEVDCWGANFWGQVGIGTTASFPPVAPGTPAVGVTDAVDLAMGREHACAVRSTGGVLCWGRNNRGQLGSGGFTDTPTPSPVIGLTNAVQVGASQYQTCVRLTTGQVACWGETISSPMNPTPLTVGSLTDAVDLAVGARHACALRSTGDVVCWGANDVGQLGDDTNANSVIPVPISPAILP